MNTIRFTICIGFFTCELASAAILGMSLGSAAPPRQVGDYDLEAFSLDPNPTIRDVFWAPGPTGNLLFDQSMSHRRIGAGWSTWSHGYSGDVYYTNGRVSITLILPPDTGAFVFYAEPNTSYLQFEAMVDTGERFLSGLAAWRQGATGLAIYSTEGETISSIRVTTYTDFAIGEFLIARVPEPGAGLFVLAAAFLLRMRRRS